MSNYVDNEEFYNELLKSIEENKLTQKSIEIYYTFMEGVLEKSCFNGYNERVKMLMTDYAIELFSRYWKKFKFLKENGEKNSAFGYFRKMIERSYIVILKDLQQNEFSNVTLYDNEVIENILSEECIYFENDFTSLDIKIPHSYYNNDIIYDYNEIVAFISENIDLLKDNNVTDILYLYFNEQIVNSLIKEDKVLVELLELKNLLKRK